MNLSQIDLWIVGAYLVATLVIGLYFGWKTDSFKDFAIGDRKLGKMALVATMLASFIGASSTISTSEKVFEMGLIFVFIALGKSIYKLIESFIFNNMQRCIKESVSPGDIVGFFYGDFGKLITGIAIVTSAAGFLGMQVKAVGYLFETFLVITPGQGILLGASLVVIYSSLGGIRAVVATDILQFAMLVVALPFLALWVLWQAGGPEAVKAALPPGHLNFFPHGPEAGKHLSMFALYAFPSMSSVALQRLLMAKNAKQGARAWQITSGICIFVYCIVGLIGLIAVAVNPKLDPGLAMPWLIQHYTSPGIYGVMIVGLLAVVMSSADSILHVTTISLTHDIIATLYKHPLTSVLKLRFARVASLVIGASAIWVALGFSDILSIDITFLNFWMVTVPVPLIAAIYGFRASPRTFLLAVAAGVVTSLGWDSMAPEGAIGAFVPSLLVHTIVFFTARLFDPSHIRIEKKEDGTTVVEAGREPVSSFSTLQAAEHAWRYALFSSYILFLYVFSLFLPGVQGYTQFTRTGFGALIAASCVGYLPMFAEAVPRVLRPHMHLYWKAAVTLCLPMTSTFMLLHEPSQLRWVFSAPVCIFLLSIMLPWKQYLISLPAGTFLGVAGILLLGNPTALQTSFKELPLWLWPNLAGVYIVAFICAYYMQTLQQKRIKAVRVGFTQGVHDGLTPASDVRNRSETVKDYLPRLLESHKKAEAAGLDVKPLTQDEEAMLRELPETLYDSAAGNLSHWTTVLYNTRGEPQKLEIELLSAADVVRNALRVYPFKYKEERKLVTVNVIKNGKFYGDKSLVDVGLFNLVNNSFHYVRKNPGSRIVITINVIGNFVVISVWDNAEGLTKEVLESMFVPMFSTREGGSGCGLSSNTKSVVALGGYMKGEGKKTKEEKFARISMFFPCCKEGAPVPKGVPKPRVTYSNIRSEKLFEERKKVVEQEIARAVERAKNNPQPPRETPEERDKRVAVQLERLKQDRLQELREEKEQEKQRKHEGKKT